MKLSDILRRDLEPRPWAEGERVPWDDPVISAQVLKEHLSQTSSAASRQRSEINKHCSWIQSELLKKRSSILDLGSGPGLYAEEFSKFGHFYTGIDISPAAITYANALQLPNCEFILGDFRSVDFRQDRDLVMLIFGAINLIPIEEAKQTLKNIFAALKPGGRVLIEATSIEAADQIGNQPSMWYSAEEGIFSPSPHLCLMESFWDEDTNAATERFYIIDPTLGTVQRHVATTIGYDPDELIDMLMEAGFVDAVVHETLTGEGEDFAMEFSIVSATRGK